MNILLLSPNFPPNYYLFAVHLRRLGANVLTISEESYNNSRSELKKAATNFYRVDSMEDYDEVYRACAFLIHKHGRIDLIESHNEYWMMLEAKIREDFNISGPKIEETQKNILKSSMKNIFTSSDIPTASGMLIRDIQSAETFINQVGYPVIAKPDRGMGAASTFKINNEEELESFFIGLDENSQYFFEDFIDGTILSFDGLTNQDGNIVFYTVHQNSLGVMETVNEDTHVYYYSYRQIPEDIKNYGFKAVKAFNLKEKFFHIEFIRRHADQQLVALEANLRPPGGYTMDMFNFANDVDLYFEWANVIVKNQFSRTYSRPYHVCFIGRKYNLQYKNSIKNILQNFQDSIVFHTPMPPIFRDAMGDYGIILRSKSMEELKPVIDYIWA